MGAPQSRKSASLPRHRTLPQSHKETCAMGRAAIWGGQRLARLAALQAQAARESERRGAYDRLGTEHKEATSLRIQRAEETGARGGATPVSSQPIRVPWRSTASQETLPASSKGFSTRWGLLGRWDEKADPLRSTLWVCKGYTGSL